MLVYFSIHNLLHVLRMGSVCPDRESNIADGNVRMEQVMNEIEKQTSYFFIVNKGVDINRTISINVAVNRSA